MRPVHLAALTAAVLCVSTLDLGADIDHRPLFERPVTYACERGATVSAVYLNGRSNDGGSGVVLAVEGRQIGLKQTRSASGVRYKQETHPSYIWHVKGNDAVLSWHSNGETEPIYLECRSD